MERVRAMWTKEAKEPAKCRVVNKWVPLLYLVIWPAQVNSQRNSSKLILYDIQLKSGNTRRHPPRQPGTHQHHSTTIHLLDSLPAMPGLLGGSWWRFTTGAYIAVGCLLMAAHLKNANVLWHNINTEAFLISCVHTLYVINRTKCGQCSWIRQRFTVCESFNWNESDKNSNWDLEFHQSTLSLLFLAQSGRSMGK